MHVCISTSVNRADSPRMRVSSEEASGVKGTEQWPSHLYPCHECGAAALNVINLGSAKASEQCLEAM